MPPSLPKSSSFLRRTYSVFVFIYSNATKIASEKCLAICKYPPLGEEKSRSNICRAKVLAGKSILESREIMHARKYHIEKIPSVIK